MEVNALQEVLGLYGSDCRRLLKQQKLGNRDKSSVEAKRLRNGAGFSIIQRSTSSRMPAMFSLRTVNFPGNTLYTGFTYQRRSWRGRPFSARSFIQYCTWVCCPLSIRCSRKKQPRPNGAIPVATSAPNCSHAAPHLSLFTTAYMCPTFRIVCIDVRHKAIFPIRPLDEKPAATGAFTQETQCRR